MTARTRTTRARTLLVTGCCGLVGSEAVSYFDHRGWRVVGIDNNMRRTLFGPRGDTTSVRRRLATTTRRFSLVDCDIRDQQRVERVFAETRPDAIIHCAAQPSHDWAKDDPQTDFSINAVATLLLLEAARQHTPEAPFILLSTNKVYGDNPNQMALTEFETRFDYANPEDHEGVDEQCSIDGCLHSLFGVSKASADLLTQEYGRYFRMPTACLRAGCLTGPNHSGVELHGFLSYLVTTAIEGRPYTIFGYKGKQVRDQLHSHDLVRALEALIDDPVSGEVFNIGGGRESNASVLECIQMIEERTGRALRHRYVDEHRVGDHICYISDTQKFRSRYPTWGIRRRVDAIIDELIEASRIAEKAS